MIVIATHNGKHLLSNLLFSLQKHVSNKDILVVDTLSNDGEHIDYLSTLKNVGINVTTTDSRNFDTGAYIWAYKNFPADTYHFMHDSILIKSPFFFQEIDKLLKTYDVVPYIWFSHMGYGDDNWKNFMNANKVSHDYDYGIFGPMFSIKKETLDKLPINDLILPIDKTQQTAFESIWPMFFERNGLNVYKGYQFDIHAIYADRYPHITKKFQQRQ